MQASMLAMLRHLLLNPASQMQFWVTAGLGALAFILVLNLIGTALDLKVAETVRSLIVLAVTLAAFLAALVYLEGRIALPPWGGPIVAVVVLLVIGAPVTCYLEKGGYLSALFALLLSTLAAAVVVVFAHAGYGAFRGGETSIGRGLLHNRETENFIDK